MNWKDIVRSVAPVIGGSLGGGFGATAAKFAVEKLTGIKLDPAADAESALEEAMKTATPEQLANLKKGDNDFKVQMAELGIREQELHAGDRDSAREMAQKTSMLPQIIISAVYTVAYGVVLYTFITGQVEVKDNHEVLFGSLIGILTAAQVQILNFWFGSSSGSKTKTAMTNNQESGG